MNFLPSWINSYSCLYFFLVEIIAVYQCENVDQSMHPRNRFSNDDMLIFSTCNSIGRYGPSNESCSLSYVNTALDSVSVEHKWPGVQIWTVPRTGQYGILAMGAMGGRSTKPLHQTDAKKYRAQYVFAFFNLTAETRLYILVGQKGEDGCSPSNCENEEVKQSSRGGGGGGATYVFQVDPVANRLTPLLIAGGGGGVGMGTFHKDNPVLCTEHNCSNTDRKDKKEFTLAGSGANWKDLIKNGRFMIGGSIVSSKCMQKNGSHQAIGGFGGGGHSCQGAGGGGGGFIGGLGGGESPSNGQDGASFISIRGEDLHYNNSLKGTHGNGEVEIYEYFYCPCEDYCIAINSENRTYKCICVQGKKLMPDKHRCTDGSQVSYLPYKVLVIPCLIGILVVAVFILTCKVISVAKRRLNFTSTEDCPGPTLVSRTTPSHINRIVMQINASYSAVNFTNPDMEITQIPREQIKCVRPIGRGAFGEVFQGTLSPTGREQNAFKVAIKTLPSVCTEELEMDFVMEAVIMSKFEHANIVKFLGVCFDSIRPHYIVLELLEGGSVREFLLEARPKPEKPTVLTVPELVKISIDVAKGCQYLEERHFIHRDIAARNCLLSTKSANRVAKIADFGMARDIYRSDYYRKTGRALLPVKWMPPEAYLDGVFTSKSDIWAYGITLWEIFSMGSNPYPGQANHEVMQFVLEGGRLRSPENCPLALYHIMTCTWDSNPDMRPSFSTIVQKLQYCYDDPNTASYKLPTFSYNTGSKCNFVHLNDTEKDQPTESRKRSSTSSMYSRSSLDSLNFNEEKKQRSYDNEIGVEKGTVAEVANGYAGDMINCLDEATDINQGIDNPGYKTLLVDLDTANDPLYPYKNTKISKIICREKGLTNDRNHSKSQNHLELDDQRLLNHSLLHRHHSQPTPNQYQNHYTHYPKRHRSLRQQKSEHLFKEEKSRLNAGSEEQGRHPKFQIATQELSIPPSPSKIPLLSSPTSEITPADDVEFYTHQQSSCIEGREEKINGLITDSTDANNIPMKTMRDLGTCSKYINLASNPAYLNTTILDENNC